MRAAGAYPGFDHPEALSRTGEYLICQAPNGAISIARHYSRLVECWSGEFFRDDAADARLNLDLPPVDIALDDMRIAGHRVRYRGRDLLSYRLTEDAAGAASRLIACYAVGATGITIDGRAYTWSDQPVELLFSPISPERLAPGIRQAWLVQVRPDAQEEGGSLYEWLDVGQATHPGQGSLHVRLPLDTRSWGAVQAGFLDPFSGRIVQELPVSSGPTLDLYLDSNQVGRWVAVFERGA